MHSWHPVLIHLPLVALTLAVAIDILALNSRFARWPSAPSLLWVLGLVGALIAIGTGLIAYTRVEHSELAHAEMVVHRNFALLATALLLVTGFWRWKRPFAVGAALLGLLGAAILVRVGYLGGDLVFRHGTGIPTETLEEVMHERGGHEHSGEAAGKDSSAMHHHDE